MVAVSLGGGKLDDKLQFLQPNPMTAQMNDADMNTMRALGVKV